MIKGSSKKSAGSKPNVKPFIQISRAGLAGWAGVLFFVCLWVFLLGIIVGRGMVPIKFNIHSLGRELLHLKADAVEKERLAYEKATKLPESTDAFSYHNVTKKRFRGIGHTKKGKRINNKPKPASHKKIQRKQAKRQKHVAHDKKPGNLTIQIAAFRKLSTAKQIAANLHRKGYSAYVSLGGNKSNRWYRVRLGHFRTKAQAASTLTLIRKKHKDALVVNK